ncbi:MAG: hypothetical protein K2H03_07500, partial [Muribaculaceae bacterium]|nr:hypothetical protein [Muribaculaceae bacterium]
ALALAYEPPQSAGSSSASEILSCFFIKEMFLLEMITKLISTAKVIKKTEVFAKNFRFVNFVEPAVSPEVQAVR